MPTGTNGVDTLFGTTGDETYDALGGADVIYGSEGTDIVNGGSGTDRLIFDIGGVGFAGAPTGPRDYVLTATSFSVGLDIDTTFTGIETFWFITTGSFGTKVDASAWVSAITTSTITTYFTLGDGDDFFTGSNTNDWVSVGLGSNEVNGGGGALDTVVQRIGNSGAAVTIATSGSVTNITQSGVFFTTTTNVERIEVGNSTTVANDQNINASATAVNIVFIDGAGADSFIGGSGNDIFRATAIAGHSGGKDVFIGGAGIDTYEFVGAGQGLNNTEILDFSRYDIIDLNLNTPAFGSSVLLTSFIGTAAFSGTAGEYRYVKVGGETRLQYDSNGDGVSDGQLVIANGAFDLMQITTANGVHGLTLLQSVVNGTAGGNTLSGTTGFDTLNGLGGDDQLYVSSNEDIINGGAGIDMLRISFGSSASPGVTQNSGNRTITIGASHVSDSAGQINTQFDSIERINIAFPTPGSTGMSTGTATVNAAAFTGSQGVTYSHALGQNDTNFTGSAQSDTVFIGVGNHVLNGGGGNDRLFYGTNSSLVAVGNGASMTITSSSNTVTVTSFEDVSFGVISGPATLDASGVTDDVTFRATYGLTILGGSGDDVFQNHYATGTPYGPSVFTGGAGADRYSYSSFGDNFDGDTITDFSAEDYIDMSFALQLGVTMTFIGNAAFTGAVNEMRYEISGGTTLLQVDTDGDGFVDDTLTIANGAFDLYMNPSNRIMIMPPGNTESGTSGNDTMTGTAFIDTLSGLGGNDTINGLAANDVLNGGEGDDTLDGGTGVDTMTGGLGNDIYYVDRTDDVIIEASAEGIDDVFSTANIYALSNHIENLNFIGVGGFTGTGNGLANIITGGTGDDVLDGGGGIDELFGGDGIDTLFGNAGNDMLFGGIGDDVLDGGTGTDTMEGGEGNDSYYVNGPSDVITERAGEGIDHVFSSGSTYQLKSTVENITLIAGGVNAVGHGGANVMTGNDGNNRLTGNGGEDTLYGMGGNDRLIGGTGDLDMLYGGDDDDFYEINDALDVVIELANEGSDTVRSNIANYTLGDHVERLSLYTNGVNGTGNELNNVINGNVGTNILSGMAGDDVIYGGAGADTIIGGAGQDQLYGQTGPDIFVFDDGDFGGVTAATADRIADFNQVQGDRIDLSLVDAIVGGGDDGFTFIGKRAFTNTAGELRYVNSTTHTTIMGDTDGDGVADFWIRLNGVHTMALGDFML